LKKFLFEGIKAGNEHETIGTRSKKMAKKYLHIQTFSSIFALQ